MTLADEVLRILQAEAARPPLKAESIRQVLRCACGIIVADGEVEVVLDALMTAGKVEAVHSMKIGTRYRIVQDRPSPDDAPARNAEPHRRDAPVEHALRQGKSHLGRPSARSSATTAAGLSPHQRKTMR